MGKRQGFLSFTGLSPTSPSLPGGREAEEGIKMIPTPGPTKIYTKRSNPVR